MEHLFDFGISQEDVQTENRVLNMKSGDRLICITSAGDVPLNLLALNDIKISSVDISENQNFLLKIKLKAALSLEPTEAAKFLGFIKTSSEHRIKLYKRVTELFMENEREFWDFNVKAVEQGVINVARFEKYIAKFNGIALNIIGKSKLLQLFELNSTDAQKEYFDSKIQTLILKNLFKLVFHPKLYKNRGISSQGFKNSGETDIGQFFFNRFRDFCCSTLARQNYFLQFSFFNQILFTEALPEFLSENGILNIQKNHANLDIQTDSIVNVLENCHRGEFNKFHISNITDWVDMNEFSNLLRLIVDKSGLNGRISSRYIHHLHPVPDELCTSIRPDYQLGDKLIQTDRYPFYNIVPLIVQNKGV